MTRQIKSQDCRKLLGKAMKKNLINKLLQPEVQKFIEKHKNYSAPEIILKYSFDKNFPIKEIAEQIECLGKADKKLPALSKHKILYKKIPLEQCSSELTANYKSHKMKGQKIIDLTGGLGIDAIYFSKNFNEVIYCELNEELAEIAEHNFKILGIKNISVKKGDGLKLLKEFENNYFDWIYVDPSRRDKDKRSVDIKYYSPDVVESMSMFLSKAKNICFKLAPAFDIKEAERNFPNMNEFSVVSVKNECKEVLIFFNKKNEKRIKSAVILNEENQSEVFESEIENNCEVEFSFPREEMFFYEPDAAIRKVGLTKLIAGKYNLKSINPLSEYLVSENEIENFPGRKFKILFTGFYNEKKIKQFLSEKKISKANIARSNFPRKPEIIKEKLKLKDGGDYYLFFTKDKNDKLIY
ncbi:MAG: class I SAM-dependent methyltransferase, partial [Melioribacteraceae bacterium]